MVGRMLMLAESSAGISPCRKPVYSKRGFLCLGHQRLVHASHSTTRMTEHCVSRAIPVKPRPFLVPFIVKRSTVFIFWIPYLWLKRCLTDSRIFTFRNIYIDGFTHWVDSR